MGAQLGGWGNDWGNGLYQNRYAATLKEDFGDWMAVSSSLDKTIKRLAERYDVETRPKSAEASAFWLAMADLLHQYGLEHEPTFKRANALIDKGTDLKLRRAMTPGEADLKDRARVLKRLQTKWAEPAKRVRRVPKLRPEPYLMQAGDVFSYDTMAGNPRYTDQAAEFPQPALRFKADGRNAFVCVATARVFFDTEPRYFIVPLALFNAERPSISDCLRARLVCHCDLETQRFQPVGGWMAWDQGALDTVNPRRIGVVDVNIEALTRVFGQSVHAPLSRHDGPPYPLWMNFGPLSPMSRGHVWGGPDDRLDRFVKAWRAV
ncbi:hypothetical protein [uncultured Litoreibacter sp.]|uniref:hypothetical protein n=1 Tax=uncultured Litoreibacter sp. TaxID=1392394 RepID=UPI0026299D57|nr:hypothetical protein [uncultured Litoreibacter sp.]